MVYDEELRGYILSPGYKITEYNPAVTQPCKEK